MNTLLKNKQIKLNLLSTNKSIGGLHCRHVRKFVHIICIKMEVNSQRRKILLFLSTNMATMTSHANHQFINKEISNVGDLMRQP